MIKNMLRGAAALSLLLTPLALPMAAAAAPAAPAAAEVLTVADAVEQIPIALEDRTNYERESQFKHWNKGLDPADGCHTRNEVLLAEAVESPTVSANCKLTGGKWLSYYDGQEVTEPGKLDIDHMVPLAEAWDSGASAWTGARREAYANDQGAAASLVAVTGRSNRSKSDRDPQDWMPPLPDVHCRYISEWVATKLRWGLTADQGEADALKVYAETCETTVVHYTPAP
ncbi:MULTISPECIES: HNH endonuclease family protein [unclassified Streptomyces]|uniref:HNH endonuclease family protein n=1 Tax=unclassified Streptomyces TaxID=2593676 RepID=UPI001E54488B|nr:HNH endonuclease family protein [Streptomyces sp. CB02980]MCB8906758.1 HNH endonuclease family protein [Streptomyces sp. CB02980]